MRMEPGRFPPGTSRMLISCPFCGERDGAEFEFRCTLSERGETAAQQLYFRMADPACSVEHWQHVRGCRAWLELQRDLRTGQVLGTSAVPASPSEGDGS
jgi:methylglutamate dehydrogenase subunit B